MNFIESIQKEIYSVTTENGDKAYSSSGSYCLDFFSLCGAIRYNYGEIINIFLRAFYEDKIKAIKILFYLRDIRTGLGERNTFRMIFNVLCNFYPDIACQVIDYVPKYGRYDDLLVGINTLSEKYILEYIAEQLKKDIHDNEEGKEISLLSKWLPSVNTSSKNSRSLAKKIREYLSLTEEEYRKILSSLRKGRIIENNLREKDYTFEYDKVPSQAMFFYRNAFARNDNEKYKAYLEDVSKGKKVVKTTTLFPYQIVHEICKRIDNCLYNEEAMTRDERFNLDVLWNNLERTETNSKTLIVRDGSGSMWSSFGQVTPNDIATSLAIYFSEILKGPFKDTFITFSENPRFVKVTGKDIFEKVENVLLNDEVANTNIGKVYDLIYRVMKSGNVSKEEMIDRIIVISDMEFDSCVSGQTSFELHKNRFEKAGFKFPEIVFWNVQARNIHVPVTMNENNVKLVSGASTKTIDLVMQDKEYNPYEFMDEVLSKYSEFDKIII